MSMKVGTTFFARGSMLAVVMILGVALTRCAADDDSAPPPPPIKCPGGPIECQSTLDAGRCADLANAKCDLKTNECVYRLNMAGTQCVCIENEARVCNLDAGVLGVKRCKAQSGPDGTRWTACEALNPP